MKKNIWIMNHYIDSYELGVMGRHRYFAKELKEKGFNVSLIYSSAAHNKDYNEITGNEKFKHRELDGINNIAIKTRSYTGNGKNRILNMFDYSNGVKREYKNILKITGKPDEIIASSVHPFTCLAGLKIAKKLHIPCIIEIRDLWPESIAVYNKKYKNSIIIRCLYWIEKYIYKKADKIIFTMEGGKNYIIDKGWEKQVNLQKIYHINNGVSIDLFEKYKNEYNISDIDLDNDTFKVVYCGSIRLVNNLKVLVECAELVDKITDNITFLVYGEGDEKEKLQNYCNAKGIKNIKFKGYVNKRYVPYILSKCDICILNYQLTSILKYGASQNKLFEYLAAGKPIITNARGNYDLIEKFNCGIATTQHSAEDTLQAILNIYNMPDEQKNELGQNSKILADDFDFKKLTEKLIKIL